MLAYCIQSHFDPTKNKKVFHIPPLQYLTTIAETCQNYNGFQLETCVSFEQYEHLTRRVVDIRCCWVVLLCAFLKKNKVLCIILKQ